MITLPKETLLKAQLRFLNILRLDSYEDMHLPFYYTVNTAILALVIFSFMTMSIIVGRYTSKGRITAGQSKNPGNTAMITSVYALLGLLLAFTFGMSGDRFRQRRTIVVNEANAISTAILRIHLYTDSIQPYLKKSFRNYLEARISYFEAGTDTTKITIALQRSKHAGDTLWQVAASNSRIPSNLVASNQMLPALNQMFDLAGATFWSEYNRTPASIITMLFLLSVSTGLVTGRTSAGDGKFDWFMAVGFCALIACVIYFIIDLDRPRAGIITLENSARAIVDLRHLIGR